MSHKARLSRIAEAIAPAGEPDPWQAKLEAAFPGFGGPAQRDASGAFIDASIEPDHRAWNREIGELAP